MTSTTPAIADLADFDWATGSGAAETVRRVAEAAAAADGRSPLNEATLLDLEHADLATTTLWTVPDGFVMVDAPSGPTGVIEMNLVVAPPARRAGLGRALAETALAAFPSSSVSAWSFGNHPAAAALAEDLGFDRVRDLWVMRHELVSPLPPVEVPDGVVVRTFEQGRDEDAVLEVNATAFHDHPEQGSLTRADLEQRINAPWFDAEGFFLAESTKTGELLGFHWTKTHEGDPEYGEVYVVGVSPHAQGLGLGKVLTLSGLHHLQDLGLGEVILFVEADNAPAVKVYTKLGFTHDPKDTDVMYARRRSA